VSDVFSPDAVARQLDYCTFCPKLCRHACPVSNADAKEHHTPQSKMDRLNQLQRGRMDWSAQTAEPLWACTECRQCTNYCLHENEPGLVLLAGRAEANARGAGHPRLADYPQRFRNRDRRLTTVLRDAFAREQFSDDAVVGFWPGCDAVDKGLDDVRAAMSLFASMDAPHVRIVAAERVCAGYPLLAAGYPDMFRWHAARVAEEIRSFRKIVINCSACLHALRSHFPAEGVEVAPQVLSIAEFLAEEIARLREAPRKTSIYYHDPCHLARHAGVIEEPRRVLSRVADVREFGWSGADTECCGGSGLLPKTMPDTADAMARRRLQNVAGRGGGTVVTSCATCTFMLKRNAPSGVDVLDLPAFMARATEDSGES